MGRAETVATQNDHTTVFSTSEFVTSWCRAFDGEPLSIPVQGSGPPRTMHVVKTSAGYSSCRISGPKPDDLWTSPGWTGELSRLTVEHLLDQMRGVRTRSLLWQVRYDHGQLALLLSLLGLTCDRVQIHVLKLDRNYTELFNNYSATTRNHVRKATNRGVIVRDTRDANDVFAYHAIYSRHAERKKWGFQYPAQMTLDLVKMSDKTCLKVAEYEGAIVGGALFLRDGNSVYYLHGVADRDYSRLFPASAVMDAGIRWSRESGAEFVNLGNSGLIINESLAAFKSSWGARAEQNWLFKWESTFWKSATKLKRSIRKFGTELKSKVLSRKAILLPASSKDGRNLDSLPWSERAQFDELSAVCVLSGTKRRNIIWHGIGLAVGEKTLSLTKKHGVSCPTIIDFGCGTGRMIRFFGNRGCSTVGLDVTSEMLKAAKRHGLPENALLVRFDGQLIPIKDCSVDIVWASGVMKYTLFPPGTRCLHGIDQLKSPNKRFVPTCSRVAQEMYRVLRPGAIVAQYEMWINEPPDVFRPIFEEAGFVVEQVKLVRRDHDLLERLCRWRGAGLLPPFLTSRVWVKFCYHFGDPSRAGFRDYFIVWRKPRSPANQVANSATWQ